ncbi:hypothetical protein HYS96_04500 [Candidatus Daviesbacteria bacterium]|nr:hypothetical protein [Candidatus Daviesbacteria bacterium]
MPILPANFVIFIIGAIAVITILLYLREYFLRKKILHEQQIISQQTRQKSVQLLGAAEQAETQLLSSNIYFAQKLESEFRAKLDKMLQNSQATIDTQTNALTKFLSNLQTKSVESEEMQRKTIEQTINQMFANLEQRLSDFLTSTEQKTTQSIELELKGARNLIESYKAQQLKLIDENIIAMMEQTLNIVLAKKLTLKDQLELVYEALEKAKVDKFVV